MAAGKPVFSRAESQLKKMTLKDPFSEDTFKSYFIIRVLVGTEISREWHDQARTYHQVIEAYKRFEKSKPRNGFIETVVTYNTHFISREWCERATVVFVAANNRVTCINNIINGIHPLAEKYQNADNLEEIALNGGFD